MKDRSGGKYIREIVTNAVTGAIWCATVGLLVKPGLITHKVKEVRCILQY